MTEKEVVTVIINEVQLHWVTAACSASPYRVSTPSNCRHIHFTGAVVYHSRHRSQQIIFPSSCRRHLQHLYHFGSGCFMVAYAKYGVAHVMYGVAYAKYGVAYAKYGVAHAKYGIAHVMYGVAYAKYGVAYTKNGVAHAKYGVAHAKYRVAYWESR